MKTIIVKYKTIISYLFFGVCTTLINIIVYSLCIEIFSNALSTILAWLISVLFAYITNKLFVFKNKSWNFSMLLKESVSFFTCRLFTGLLDFAFMLFTVNYLNLNNILMKIISNIIVIILNYVASKLLIFKK